MSDQAPLLTGGCFCGAASFSVYEPPVLSAYCHCTLCQRLTGCPFVHTNHFEASAFSWTHAVPYEARLDSYINPIKPYKKRWRCKSCGAALTSYNSKTNRVSIWGSQFERDENSNIKNWDVIKPTAHTFYGTRILDVGDNLGKWEGYEGKSEKLT